MLYNQCAAVNEEFWRALRQADPEDIARRTGIRREQNAFRFSFFNQEAVADVSQQRVFREAAPDEEPGFRLCLISLLYLLYVDTAATGRPSVPWNCPAPLPFSKTWAPCDSQRPSRRAVRPRTHPVSSRWAPSWERKASQW